MFLLRRVHRAVLGGVRGAGAPGVVLNGRLLLLPVRVSYRGEPVRGYLKGAPIALPPALLAHGPLPRLFLWLVLLALLLLRTPLPPPVQRGPQ